MRCNAAFEANSLMGQQAENRSAMSRDVKRTISLYTRLFTLPRSRTTFTFILIFAIVVGGLTDTLRTFGTGGLIVAAQGALRGLLLVLPPAGITMLSLWLTTRRSGILRRHRLMGIMAVATFLLLQLWLVAALLGWGLEVLASWLFGAPIFHGLALLFSLRGFLLGSGFSLAIIYLVVLSTTTAGSIKGAVLSLLFPSTSIAVFVLTEPLLLNLAALWLFVGVFGAACIIMIFCVQVFLYAVGRPLKRAFNVDGIQLFRGFLSVWSEGKPDQIEACFKRIGQSTSVPLAVIRFIGDGKQPSLVFVVADVHPGPFKDTGSSRMPAAVAQWGRSQLNTVACALHGTVTHDLNLVAREELDKLLADVQGAYEQAKDVPSVSHFVRVRSDAIQAGCQLFGGTALIIFTRSPEAMDDISLAVGRRVAAAVEKVVDQSIIVDAHNCIGKLKQPVHDDSPVVPAMLKAAVQATRQALTAPRGQPRVGVATDPMQQFTPVHGMGSGGVTAVLLEVEGQRMAYVIIDGNNMALGLRERLYKELVPNLVDEAEILTTDTHEVNAISTKGEGYSPIGLDIPPEEIIQAIKRLVGEAKHRLRPVKVGVHVGETSSLHVMGEGTTETLTELIPQSAKIAKRTGLATFSGALLITLLLLTLV
jgi:putative membrane protein